MSTWILLRGLTREKRHWRCFPQQLAEELEGARVIPLELPGNGELNGLSSPSSIEAMASYCHTELVRLGVRPPYHLLAMSMGAMVATAWAVNQPEEVAACVLINTSFGGFSPVHHRFRPLAWKVLFRFLATRSFERREALLFNLTSRLLTPSVPVIEEWVAIRRSRPVRALNALRQLIAAARFRAPSAPSVPTLILSSARDSLADPRCSREIAYRWHCAMAIHPSAGHDLPLDDGGWVAKEVHRWLMELGDLGKNCQ
jgi:pimeloyl-ACP methyl ester carboxylesterase